MSPTRAHLPFVCDYRHFLAHPVDMRDRQIPCFELRDEAIPSLIFAVNCLVSVDVLVLLLLLFIQDGCLGTPLAKRVLVC